MCSSLLAWSKANKADVALFSNDTGLKQGGPVIVLPIKTGLDGLLERPVTVDELEIGLGGSMAGLRKLVAPATLESKFNIIGCQRHRLMSAFGE